MSKQTEKENRRNKQRRIELRMQLTRQRADTFFWIYHQLGPDRSLESLQEFCTKIGLRRAISTLKRYSVDYDWQNKLMEIEAKIAESRELSHIAQVQKMNESQARDGRNMRSIARAGINAFINLVQATGSIDLSPQDIATLMREGTKIERLAMGEATDRLEAIALVWNNMVLNIINIFNEINTLRNPLERRKAFAEGIDKVREQYIIELEGKSS